MSRFVMWTTAWKPVEVSEEELMSITEAAERLGVTPQTVEGLNLRGRMRWIRDTSEPNSRKQGRVLREDVLRELARRRGRREDRRLNRKRGRPVG